MSHPELRLATDADLPAINDIYNYYVARSTTTYDESPMSAAEREAWFAGRAEIHPVTIIAQGEEVLAWGALGPFRARHGYRFSVENSVYVHPHHVRRGVGSQIVRDQLARARELGLHAIVAVIDAGQSASIALHGKLGFVEVARLPQAGRKFDRWLDVVYMQIVLEG